MSEDSEDDAFSEPETPSLDGVKSQDYYTEDGIISLSPPPSPSMSLHSLGMSPLSPLRHSPILHRVVKTRLSSVDRDSEQDLSQDNRDVLVQRLNDLVSRLSGGGELLGDGVTNLHVRVDEMEQILRQSSSPKAQGHRRDTSSISSIQGGPPPMSSGHPSPVQQIARLSGVPLSDTNSAAVPPRLLQNGTEEASQKRRSHFGDPSDHARRVLRDAEQLHGALTGVVMNLKARQEEQDVILTAPFFVLRS